MLSLRASFGWDRVIICTLMSVLVAVHPKYCTYACYNCSNITSSNNPVGLKCATEDLACMQGMPSSLYGNPVFRSSLLDSTNVPVK